MKKLVDCEGLSRGELELEIAMRRKMQSQMVGQLYPSILENEVYELYAMLRQLDQRSSTMSNLTEDGLPLVLEVERQKWEAEKKKLTTERDILRAFVDGVAVVEWIKTDKNGERCGYCGCDAAESNGPITCHVEPCLQIRARQVLIKADAAAKGPL